MKQNIFKWAVITAVLIGNVFISYGQNSKNTDSLALTEIIKEIISSHPSIKEAEEAIKDADTKISIAKYSNYPDFDLTSSYTRIGPVTSLSFPGFGTFDMYPANNYSASVNYNQKLYDFGRKSLDVEYANKNKDATRETIEQVKQRLAMSATNCYYAIVYLQDAIEIKNEQLNTLREHLNYVEKKKATGSATEYEILTTKVKISGIESQKMDLENALKVQLSIINSLIGKPQYISRLKKELNTKSPGLNEDSLISYAYGNRDEMKILKVKTELSEIKYKVIKAQNNPMLNIFGNAGGKNGYIPDLNKIKANFVAGIGFKLPIYDANRNKNNLLLAKSEIQINNYEQELTKRNISNDIIENLTNISLATKKVKQFELQLNQAKEALRLAEASYKAGTITNLEVLDATTSLSESRLMLMKSHIDYTISILKLKNSIGERLY
ncbi:MAG: TolC family protein [Bacteroidota bacterium]|nr:TolC family protein [Bacteroidota bacterium]